jgi:translocation and assembly module TamB
VKRRVVLVAFTTAVLLGALWWLMGTPSGALWLIRTAAARSGLALDVREIHGSLCGDLRVEGLRLAWRDGLLASKSLSLQWRPLSLFSGTISVRRLELDRVNVFDNTPEHRGAVDLTWPRVTGLPLMVDASVDLLMINGLTYRRASRPVFEITSLQSSALWREGTLVVSVRAESASMRGRGRMSVGLERPSFGLDAEATLSRPVAGIDRMAAHAALGAADEKGAQISGRTTFSAISGTSSPVFSCSSEISVMRRSLIIKGLALAVHDRRGAVTGDGRIDFAGGKPQLTLKANIHDLDLSPETRFLSHVSGSLGGVAADGSYRGTFDISNSDTAWRKGGIAGVFEGDDVSAQFSVLGGTLLRGSVGGEIKVAWGNGLSVKGFLNGRKLDPSEISPELYGSVNFNAEGRFSRSGETSEGAFSLHLPESSLRGRSLYGEIEAAFRDSDVVLSRMLLEGRGFSLRAEGRLKERISFSAAVSDLSGLVPPAKGRFSAEGWAKVSGEASEGSVTISGRAIRADGLRIGAVRASGHLGQGKDHRLDFLVDVKDISYGRVVADFVALSLKGTQGDHSATFSARSGTKSMHADISGGYAAGTWKGAISALSGHDSAGRFVMAGQAALKISAGETSLSPIFIIGEKGGSVSAEWTQLDLSHTAWFAPDLNLAGKSSGKVRAEIANGTLSELTARVSGSGQMVLEGKTLDLRTASAAMTWDAHGMDVSMESSIAGGGIFSGHITSASPAQLSLPPGGTLDLQWSGIDLIYFRRWTPRGLDLGGDLSGKTSGTWTREGYLQLRVSASVSNGHIRLKEDKGTIGTEIRSATASADWRGESMTGSISFDLADHGEASGRFDIPLPARLPPEMDMKGKVSISLHGQAHEEGLLSAFFPGLVRESRGDADMSLRVEGQWELPVFSGDIRIEKAGAYFPQTGIHVKDVSLKATLDGDTVNVVSFHAESGPGSLDGTGIVRLKGWRLQDYRANLKGDRFQAFYLPELRVAASPSLSIEGTPKKMGVKGDILVSELLATGSSSAVVKPSADVVLTGPRTKGKEGPSFPVEMNIKVILGDHVLVKEEGFDVRLKGSVLLAGTPPKSITGRGQIDIAKGRYATYGVNLDIARGRLLFSGGPADNPSLDVLALRKAGDVKAGVLVSGTLNSPIVNLYSEPSMDDADILSYVVLGHPVGGSSGEETSLLIRAAGQLLSAGQSVTLQDKIKQTIGLDTLDVESGSGGVARSMVTVGKYLTPKLYISYGRSLFSSGDLFRTRYSLTKKWEVDVSSGAESGADIFFTIDFR